MKVIPRRASNIIILTFFIISLYLLLNIRIYRISGNSMSPVLKDNQILFVFRGGYGIAYPHKSGYIFQWKKPSKNDIIVFYNPIGGSLSVKRCIGTAGDTLIFKNSKLYLNDVPLPPSPFPRTGRFRDGNIADSWIFLMGDNTAQSVDSRNFGPLPLEAVIGKVIFISKRRRE